MTNTVVWHYDCIIGESTIIGDGKKSETRYGALITALNSLDSFYADGSLGAPKVVFYESHEEQAMAVAKRSRRWRRQGF